MTFTTVRRVRRASKDGEYVDFDNPRLCVGQVGNWLNILLDTMQSTIYHELTEAVVAFQKNVREQWIFDPPAQVTYLVCNLLHHSL